MAKTEIVVEVKGGIVQNVALPADLPAAFSVRVEDRDNPSIEVYEREGSRGVRERVQTTAWRIDVANDSHIRNNVRPHLLGREVVSHRASFGGVDDPKRALQGKETGLVNRVYTWYTIDGIPVGDLGIPEIKAAGLVRSVV